MTGILLKALAYVFIILLGYILKIKGFFAPGDQRVVSNIVMNITFPAAIITNFASLKLDRSLYSIIVLGVILNLALIALGWLFSRGKPDGTRGLYMLSVSGFNIGLFSLPFIQNFLGAFGAGILSLFDIGNAALVTGGTYAIASQLLKRKESSGLLPVLNVLLASAPFVTYMTMMILSFIQIPIPATVTAFTAPIGAANPFMAMLMVGLMLEIRGGGQQAREVTTVLILRLLGSSLLALIAYFLLPYSLAVRQILVLLLFSPLSGLTPVFTQKLGGDAGQASLLASLTVLSGLIIMTSLIVVMGL
ncbi:MAG: AEC family transporter [Clostridia bacterium]|nr:AEC family transporter [Clostridia bacterium]